MPFLSLPPNHEKFFSYYRQLMRDVDGAIPNRASVRPADIKPLLPWIAMAERKGTDHLVPTVIGSAVDEILHVSFTGVNLFDFLNGAVKQRMNAFYSNITDTPCGGFMVRTLATQNGLTRGYESSLYPLKGKDGEINRLIGIVSLSAEKPLLAEFGKPQDIETVDIVHEEYLDIGFGLPGED